MFLSTVADDVGVARSEGEREGLPRLDTAHIGKKRRLNDNEISRSGRSSEPIDSFQPSASIPNAGHSNMVHRAREGSSSDRALPQAPAAQRSPSFHSMYDATPKRANVEGQAEGVNGDQAQQFLHRSVDRVQAEQTRRPTAEEALQPSKNPVFFKVWFAFRLSH